MATVLTVNMQNTLINWYCAYVVLHPVNKLLLNKYVYIDFRTIHESLIHDLFICLFDHMERKKIIKAKNYFVNDDFEQFFEIEVLNGDNDDNIIFDNTIGNPLKDIHILFDAEMDCSICLSLIIHDQCERSCGHHFHKDCINKWLQMRPTCPVCRKNIYIRAIDGNINYNNSWDLINDPFYNSDYNNSDSGSDISDDSDVDEMLIVECSCINCDHESCVCDQAGCRRCGRCIMHQCECVNDPDLRFCERCSTLELFCICLPEEEDRCEQCGAYFYFNSNEECFCNCLSDSDVERDELVNENYSSHLIVNN